MTEEKSPVAEIPLSAETQALKDAGLLAEEESEESTETSKEEPSKKEPLKEETSETAKTSKGEKPEEPSEPKEESKKEQPQVNIQQEIQKHLSENLGEFDTTEKVVAELERLRVVETKFKELPENYIPNPSDYVKKIYDIEQGGGNLELFHKVNSVKVDNLSDKEAVSLKLQWENGLSADDANFKINNQYAIGKEVDEEDPDSADKIRGLEIDLKTVGSEAKKFIRGQQAEASKIPEKNEEPKETEEEKISKEAIEKVKRDKLETERVESWQPATKEIVDGFVKLDLPINEKGHTTPYEIEDDTRTKIDEYIKTLVTNFKIPPTDEWKKYFQDQAYKHFLSLEWENMLKVGADKARSINEEEWHTEVHNASAKNKEDTSPVEPEVDIYEENARIVEEFEFGKRITG